MCKYYIIPVLLSDVAGNTMFTLVFSITSVTCAHCEAPLICEENRALLVGVPRLVNASQTAQCWAVSTGDANSLVRKHNALPVHPCAREQTPVLLLGCWPSTCLSSSTGLPAMNVQYWAAAVKPDWAVGATSCYDSKREQYQNTKHEKNQEAWRKSICLWQPHAKPFPFGDCLAFATCLYVLLICIYLLLYVC